VGKSVNLSFISKRRHSISQQGGKGGKARAEGDNQSTLCHFQPIPIPLLCFLSRHFERFILFPVAKFYLSGQVWEVRSKTRFEELGGVQPSTFSFGLELGNASDFEERKSKALCLYIERQKHLTNDQCRELTHWPSRAVKGGGKLANGQGESKSQRAR